MQEIFLLIWEKYLISLFTVRIKVRSIWTRGCSTYDDYANCLSSPTQQITRRIPPLYSQMSVLSHRVNCNCHCTRRPEGTRISFGRKNSRVGYAALPAGHEGHCTVTRSFCSAAPPEPQIFKTFIESFYCERKRNTIVVILQSNLKCLAKEVEKWPLFKDQIACKLHTVADKALDFLMSQ